MALPSRAYQNKSSTAYFFLLTITYQARYKMAGVSQIVQPSCSLLLSNEFPTLLSSKAICSFNDDEWDRLARSDMAEKYLEYLDNLNDDKDDGPEFISDWLNEDKFCIDLPRDLPTFDDFVTNTTPNSIEMKPVEYQKFVPSNKAIPYQPYPTQQYTPLCCQQSSIQPKFNYIPPVSLTPPESPKDTDVLMSMLDDMQPEELSQLVVDEDTLSDFMSSDASSHTDSYCEIPTKRAKPYSPKAPNEEKRLRKKEQNKNAATRYRMKKKAEIKESVMEEKQLLKKNDHLKDEAKELAREIKYLKSLLRDVYKAKGLLD